MVNKAFLIGNMGNDPTVRQAGESKVASFTLATSDRVKKNGEYVNETTWHNIVVWGKQADFVEKYLKKGSMIHVEGKINNRSYEDKDGNKKNTVVVGKKEDKVGRNDLCPCGSGKKYKKCHGK